MLKALGEVAPAFKNPALEETWLFPTGGKYAHCAGKQYRKRQDKGVRRQKHHSWSCLGMLPIHKGELGVVQHQLPEKLPKKKQLKEAKRPLNITYMNLCHDSWGLLGEILGES